MLALVGAPAAKVDVETRSPSTIKAVVVQTRLLDWLPEPLFARTSRRPGPPQLHGTASLAVPASTPAIASDPVIGTHDSTITIPIVHRYAAAAMLAIAGQWTTLLKSLGFLLRLVLYWI